MEISNTALDIRLNLLELSIIAELQKVAQIVRLQGYACRAYSPKSLIALQGLTPDKQEQISSQLQSIINLMILSNEIELPTTGHKEKIFVDYAIKLNGLELRDEDFWSKVQKDDVIEVYSAENIQLFRTFNFFKISSYSLLDLLTLEWYVLWQRPSFVLNALIEAATAMMKGEIKTATQINAARHILKEIYDDDTVGFKCSSVLVEPGVTCPLYAPGSNEVKGFLFSLRGTVMGYGSEVDKISMI